MTTPTATLNSGHEMPLVGYGTWPLTGARCTEAVLSAVEAGYRLVDTAARYENEDAVGVALRECGVPREELFVTTKLRGAEHGEARKALTGSLERLGLDHVDLYLIHWPLARLGRFVETYEQLLELAGEGLIRSVGVSNFKSHHLDAIVAATGVAPAVDQIQLSPTVARVPLVADLERRGTVPQAWSPLDRNRGLLADPVLTGIADRLGVTTAQVALRWALQRGAGVVPHSADPGRQRQNADVFGFELTPADVEAVTALDEGSEGDPLDADRHEEF